MVIIKGIYTSAAGMGWQQGLMGSVSHNLANATVPGYKKDRLLAMPFPQLIQLSSKLNTSAGLPTRTAIGTTNQGAAVGQIVIDFTPGVIAETGLPTDYALRGEGFFTLVDPAAGQDENTYYTRKGNFNLDLEGYLINDDGYRVLGTGGFIQIDPGQDFVVNELGQVLVAGEVINSFMVATFNNERELERIGYNMYRPVNEEPALLENPGLVQGYLEMANVNPADETVQMISAVRAYETGQKIIQAQDGLLDLAINKIGRLR